MKTSKMLRMSLAGFCLSVLMVAYAGSGAVAGDKMMKEKKMETGAMMKSDTMQGDAMAEGDHSGSMMKSDTMKGDTMAEDTHSGSMMKSDTMADDAHSGSMMKSDTMKGDAMMKEK